MGRLFRGRPFSITDPIGSIVAHVAVAKLFPVVAFDPVVAVVAHVAVLGLVALFAVVAVFSSFDKSLPKSNPGD